MNRAVFLDRDGVINRAIIVNGKPYPPKSLKALEILPGVASAMESLHKAGWFLIVITNQPDVARGTVKRTDVEMINNHLEKVLPIDEFRTCYHDNSDGCQCRKPRPGALIGAANSYNLNLHKSYIIGDRWSDIEAGINAGCKTIFLDYGYKEKQPQSYSYCVHSLAEATEIILRS